MQRVHVPCDRVDVLLEQKLKIFLVMLRTTCCHSLFLFLLLLTFVVHAGASDCLQTLVSKMTYLSIY